MRSLFSPKSTVGRPGHGGPMTPRIRPLLPAYTHACWLAAVLIIAALLPSARAAESAGDGWEFSAIPRWSLK